MLFFNEFAKSLFLLLINIFVFVQHDVHISLQEYKENIAKMVKIVREKLGSTTPIILITPPPVWEEELYRQNRMKGKLIIEDRDSSTTLKYVKVKENKVAEKLTLE